MMSPGASGWDDEPTLVDVLDQAIDAGVVVSGDVVLSVADVDLVHVGLRLLLRGIDGAPPADVPGITGDAIPPPAGVTTARGRPPPRVTAHADDGRVPDPSAGLERLLAAGRSGELDPHGVQRGLAALVLAIVDLLRELMERRAIDRMASRTVDAAEVERLGRTFLALRERLAELKDAFGLTDDDLDVHLGPLGRLS